MANQIQHASKFLPVIDQIYKNGSYTARFDTTQLKNWFGGVNEIKISKIKTTGLGNYDRETGYPSGDVTNEWEVMKLTQERGKSISVDRIDDEETLGLVFGQIVNTFMNLHVIPELDSYRFTKYLAFSGHKEENKELTKENILHEIDEGIKFQNSREVPTEGKILFVNSDLQPILSSSVGRTLVNESQFNNVLNIYNGIPIVYVTPSRFNSKIKINSGQDGSFGFQPDTDSKKINFILMNPSAVIQGIKFNIPRIFTPDENQEKDAWKFRIRIYHDVFKYDNRVNAIYSNVSNTQSPANN